MAGSNRAQRLSGINPLAYLGVEPLTPPLLVVDSIAPTQNDVNGFFLGSVWVVTPAPYSIWILVSLAQHIATWVQIYPAAGSGGITKFGVQAGTNPVVPDGTGLVTLNGASAIVGLLTTVGGLNEISFVLSNDVPGKFTTDTGPGAIGIANIINVTGVGSGVLTTSSAANSIGIGFTTATNGQIIIGQTAGTPAWANLTSTGGTVTITNGPNTINLEATGTDVGATTFVTDSGSATVAVTTITIAGGANISTSGAASTVTINVAKTTNHTVQVGTGTVGLTQVGPGSAGQVLLSGGAAADPSYVTPTATGGGGLVVTTNASTLSYGISAPVSIANGGTNATSFATTDGTVIYDGTRLVTTATGTTGQVLTSNGAGVAPTYKTFGGVAGTEAFSAVNATEVHNAFGTVDAFANAVPYYLGTSLELSVLYDNGFNFFPGDGVGTAAFYTAPASGIYVFSFGVASRNDDFLHVVPTFIVSLITTTARKYYTNVTTYTPTSSPSAFNTTFPMTITADMTIGDTATFAVLSIQGGTDSVKPYSVYGDGTTTNLYTYISGYRLA